ncbi:DUF2127 domain-containing protein [Gallaecimonas pentaromativorans]|nr:DUF2127 domain-containing protein [Gallaecimonas pentaromativorans]MED5525939.1 DUF2127 domain-containing protein [Pseudomonadota bacterium]
MAHSKKGLRAVAMLEASKGILALLVAIGLHTLAGKDVAGLMETLVHRMHLSPDDKITSLFMDHQGWLTGPNVSLFALAAFGYSLIRFVEAYGLWRSYTWTEWFALLSGAIYLPFEIYELCTRPGWLSLVVFLINIVVVSYMAFVLRENKKGHDKTMP